MVLLIIIPFLNGYFIGNIPNIFRQTHIMVSGCFFPKPIHCGFLTEKKQLIMFPKSAIFGLHVTNIVSYYHYSHVSYYYHQYSIIKDLSPLSPDMAEARRTCAPPAPGTRRGRPPPGWDPSGWIWRGAKNRQKTQKCQKTWSNHGKIMVKSW